MAATAKYGSLPFAEQVEFFRRKLNVNTQAWTDVLEAEHDVAFMVAGANRDDLVADFREAIRKAIEGGATLEDFRKDFDRIVTTYGWEYTGGRNWRSRVIYETNLRQSYNAGRWKQLQAGKQARPYWQYKHSDAVAHPRPLHESWDGLVLLADDPWWLTHFPANGWGCQCYVQGLNDRDLQRLGKSGPDTAPAVQLEPVFVGKSSPGGPRMVMTPAGVDPGFGYAPGRTEGTPEPRLGPEPEDLQVLISSAAQSVIEKAARLPAELGAKSIADAIARPRVASAIEAGFLDWRLSVVAQVARPATYGIGGIELPIVRSLAEAGIEAATAAITVPEATVLAALQPELVTTLTASELSALPRLLRAPAAVLLDVDARTLLYVGSDPLRMSPGHTVMTVQLGDAGANSVSTAGLVTAADLNAQVRSGRLQLLQGSLD